MTEETKKCVYCAETIQKAAIVCRFCGRDLPVGPRIERKELGYTCSACGHFLSPASEKCENCGAQFVGKALPGVEVKKTNRFTLYALGSIAVVALLIWVFSAIGRGTGPPRPTNTTYTVLYRVEGTARGASLTYQNAGGDTEQKDVAVPWSQSYSMREGQFVYVSAQNKYETGTIVCKILLDGVVVKTAESAGAYKIASCSGKI